MAPTPRDGSKVLLPRSLDARAVAGSQGTLRGSVELSGRTMMLVELDNAIGFCRMIPSDALIYLDELAGDLDAELEQLLG